mmetsp:Transcript_1247/g.1780  ORF Transcript_1247/g.1780 Transcript_1247/m.1780 type:complete len:429 (-) Transcript_1247:112-1398(-)
MYMSIATGISSCLILLIWNNLNHASAFTITTTTTATTKRRISKRLFSPFHLNSSNEDDDFFNGYDDFVNDLKLDQGNWYDKNSDNSFVGNRPQPRRNERRNGKARKSGPRKERDFGPTGHDYQKTGGPIDTDYCRFDVSEIDSLLAQRLRFKMNRQFQQADEIQDHLRGNGVVVHDGFKEWRADGEDWERSARTNNPRSNGESWAKKYTMVGKGRILSPEDLLYVTNKIVERSEAKAARDYDMADDIKVELSNTYDVTIDDRNSVWAVRAEEYVLSSKSDEIPDEETQNIIGTKLGERTTAKQNHDYDTADYIRDQLFEEYSVSINDRQKEYYIEVADNNDDASYDTHGEYTIMENTLDLDKKNMNLDKSDFDINTSEPVVTRSLHEDNAAEVDFESLTVVQLKEMLRDAGLKVSGRKEELIQRLTDK